MQEGRLYKNQREGHSRKKDAHIDTHKHTHAFGCKHPLTHRLAGAYSCYYFELDLALRSPTAANEIDNGAFNDGNDGNDAAVD